MSLAEKCNKANRVQNQKRGIEMGTEITSHVFVTDIRMPFWSMVLFMIKWAVAAIPAFIMLAVLGGVAAALLSGLGMMIGTGR